MATGTVTLDKAYFETLLRRAQFHTSGVDFTTPVNLPTVTIPKLDHDSLLKTAREYTNLRHNLYKGGVSDETLAILIDNNSATQGPNGLLTNFNTADIETEATFETQNPRSFAGPMSTSHAGAQGYTYSRNNSYNGRNGNGFSNGFANPNNGWDESSSMLDGPMDGIYEVGHDMKYQSQSRHQKFSKNAKRTVLLVNLPEGVTHAEIVDIVRGGMLLDVFLRSNDHSCGVSFLDQNHARDFYQFVKRNDLYIRNKRIEIRWHDRQFILPGHVANKVGIGATRNLVIRNPSPKHTEEMIRDDLEHIHNLVVISVKFEGKNAHISTNSVHNALFARTCMMSRGAYKGSKIDWDHDECAEPLPKASKIVQKENVPLKKAAPVVNRFELLNMDDGEDDSLDESNVAGGLNAFMPNANGVAV